MYNQNDDLKSAIENNGLSLFEENEIVNIVAEVPGQNDEYSWWWVLELTDNRYALLRGSCDYTGWDCRSSLDVEGLFTTALLAAEASPFKDKWSERYIRTNLVNQVKGTQPKFTYSDPE
jgi:hypothetical protein